MPRTAANGVEIAYEEMGDRGDPVLLLVMGLSAQMVWWDSGFCAALVGRGFRLVRFDNRDVGLSSKCEGRPDLQAIVGGDSSSVSYTLEDMADDTAALLGALGIEAAHVVGASMGGMIAQALAIRHPARVLSLCSIMSTTGAPGIGQPTPEAVAVLLREPATDWDGYLAGALETARVIGSPGFPFGEERIRARAARSWERGYHPEGVARQMAAILAASDRTEALGRVRVPTLVIHGDGDPLVTPGGGEATAQAVPGARLLSIQGMGHDLPPEVWGEVVDAIAANANQAAVAEAAPSGTTRAGTAS